MVDRKTAYLIGAFQGTILLVTSLAIMRFLYEYSGVETVLNFSEGNGSAPVFVVSLSVPLLILLFTAKWLDRHVLGTLYRMSLAAALAYTLPACALLKWYMTYETLPQMAEQILLYDRPYANAMLTGLYTAFVIVVAGLVFYWLWKFSEKLGRMWEERLN